MSENKNEKFKKGQHISELNEKRQRYKTSISKDGFGHRLNNTVETSESKPYDISLMTGNTQPNKDGEKK